MSSRIDWDGIVGRAVYYAIIPPLRAVERLRSGPAPLVPPDHPVVTTTTRPCRDCGTETTHSVFHWRIEDETTVECQDCEGTWVIG